MFAWSLTRDTERLRAVGTWAAAIAVIMVSIAARLYVGWTSTSAAVVSIVVGSLWAGAIAVMVRTRELFKAVARPTGPRPIRGRNPRHRIPDATGS